MMDLAPGSYRTEMLVDGARVWGTVTVDQKWIDVTTEFEPDPHWVYVDGHGHDHRWVLDGDTGSDRLPSLTEARDDIEGQHWCPECQGEWQPWRYVCRLCGEVVKPKSRRTVDRRYIPGLKDIRIDAEEWLPLGDVAVWFPAADPEWIVAGRVVNREGGGTGGRLWGKSHIVAVKEPTRVN